MENKSMRFLSLLLALVMVISLMPVGHVHAEEGGLIKVPAAEAATELGLENIGDSAEFVIATGRKDRAVKTMIGNAVSGGGKSGVELINDAPDAITFADAPAAFWTITKVEGGYTISVDGTNSVQINGNNNATLAEGAVVQIRVSENGSYGTGYFEIFNSIDGTNYFLNYFDSFGGVTASGCAASVWSDNDPGSQWQIYKVIEKAPEIDIWNKAAWTKVSVDTETAHNDTEGLFEYAFDGKLNTIWHSNWKDGANDVLTGENTFAGEINFGQEHYINQFSFLPRQDDTNWANGDGVVTLASLYVKDADDTEWKLVAEHQEFEHNQDLKTFTFEAQNVQYVRFVAERSVYNGWVAVAEFYINYEKPAAHEHSYEAVVTAPTCTTFGYTTYTCATCGYSYVDDLVDALGHSYEVDVTAPTCTEGGYTTYTCTVCGDSYVVDVVDALGHTPAEPVKENETPSDLNNEGSYDLVVYCTVCEEELSRETHTVPPLEGGAAMIDGYKYETFKEAVNAAEEGDTIVLLAPVVITEDTELDLTGKTLDGNGMYPAIRVQNSALLRIYGGNFVNETDYLFTIGAADGVTNHDLSKAGNLSIVGGNFKAMTSIVSVTYGVVSIEGGTFECVDGEYGADYMLNCVDSMYNLGAWLYVFGGTFVGFNPMNNAAEGPGTNFVFDGYCAAEENGIYTVQDHTEAEAVRENEKDATCTEDGSYDLVVHCTFCGEEMSRETVTVKATGHKPVPLYGYPATCDAPGMTDGAYCERCDATLTKQEPIAPLGHKPVTIPGYPATCDAPGMTDGSYCERCDATLTKQETIAPLGHKPVTIPGYPATCDAPGMTDGSYCERCDATLTKQEPIAPLGHNYEDGNCTRCGEADPDFVAVIATGWSGYTEWALTADGVLTFTSSGQTLNGETNLKNYWKVNGVLTLPWGQYADMITKVVIEDGIHDIGQMAFYELPNLTTVELGKDVTEIRNYTFKNCKNLTSINLESVDFIREGAFYGCAALENITFAEGVVVEDWAFSRTPYVEMNP